MRDRIRKENRKRFFILGILLFTITIGYAALNTSLNINGTTGISNATWDIHFANLNVTTGSVAIGTGDSAATITQGNPQEVTYAVTLNVPGDFYEFTVDAVNSGSIDAMVNTITSTYKIGNGTPTAITSSNLPAYLAYSATYSDGQSIVQNHELKANSTEKYKVRIEFKKDIDANQLPSSAQTITFNFAVNYKQADSNATVVEHPIILYGVHGGGQNGYTTQLNQPVPSDIVLRQTPNEVMNDWDLFLGQSDPKPYYLKYKVLNNIITESYLEFVVPPEILTLTAGTYSLRGGVDESSLSDKPIYEANKAVLLSAFDSSNCQIDSSYIYCGNNEDNYADFAVNIDGSVDLFEGSGWHCNIYSDGQASCEWQ